LLRGGFVLQNSSYFSVASGNTSVIKVRHIQERSTGTSAPVVGRTKRTTATALTHFL
jgi:hypothetical protein